MYGCSLNRTADSIVNALVRSRGRQEVTSPKILPANPFGPSTNFCPNLWATSGVATHLLTVQCFRAGVVFGMRQYLPTSEASNTVRLKTRPIHFALYSSLQLSVPV